VACAALALCCTAGAACGKKEAPPPRGLVDEQGASLLPAKRAPPAVEAEEERPEPDFGSVGSPFPDSPFPSTPAPSAPGAANPSGTRPSGAASAASGAGQAAPQAAPRDLAQELLGVLPTPATCVDFAKAAENGGKLEISVEATVMPSGRISRASVSAPGQSAQAVRCLEQGVLGAALKPDVPSAPLTVRATLPLEIVAQTRPAAPTAPAPAQPSGDVARPDGTELAQPSD
jgi:hypothetical protein